MKSEKRFLKDPRSSLLRDKNPSSIYSAITIRY